MDQEAYWLGYFVGKSLGYAFWLSPVFFLVWLVRRPKPTTASCFVPTKQTGNNAALPIVGSIAIVSTVLLILSNIPAPSAPNPAQKKAEELRGWMIQGEKDAKNGVFARQMRDRAAALDAAAEAADKKDREHRRLLGLPDLLPVKNMDVIFACPKCGKDQRINPHHDRIDQEIAHLRVCQGI